MMSDDEDCGGELIRPTLAGSIFQPVSDVEREMANKALQEFEEGKYDDSFQTLRRLMARRPEDIKILHNIYVVQYYISNFRDTAMFKENNMSICEQAHINLEGTETLDDVDNCALLYNQGVVLFHLHQFNAAIQIVEKIVQYIEPLEETMGKNICFLICDVYLSVHQPKRLHNLISYMENTYLNNSKNSSKNNSKEDVKDDNAENESTEQFKRRFQLTKARLYAILKTSKACKREIKNLMSSGSGVQNIPVFYYKSQLEYQRGNYRKAIKLLNSPTLPNDFLEYFKETGDAIPVIFYNNNGCIHFYMGKPNLGKFYTRKAIEEFEKLITGTNSPFRLDPENALNYRPLHLMCVSTHHQLIFNMGLQCMQLQQFDDAFRCFMEVIRSYCANPRLWLRIAECCIQIHKPNNMEQYTECLKKPVIKSVVGAGIHQKLILNSSVPEKFEELKNTDFKEISPSLQFAMLCLKNAISLLPENNSAPSLVYQGSKVSCSLDDVSAYVSDDNYHLSVLPSTYITGSEIASLRNSILVACSYVSLCLGDLIPTLAYATQLLSQPCISGAHKFLGHLYAGEALLLMDRITDAVEHFAVQHESDIELAFPASSSEVSLKHQMRLDSKVAEKNDDGSRPVGNVPNWFPNTISSARFVSLYNLAVAYAVREEWTKALECLQQMSTNGDIPFQAYSLLIYVQLHHGCSDDLKTYVKQSLISGY